MQQALADAAGHDPPERPAMRRADDDRERALGAATSWRPRGTEVQGTARASARTPASGRATHSSTDSASFASARA